MAPATEHKSVLDPLVRLSPENARNRCPASDGRLSLELWRTIREDTVLISVMAANNEIERCSPSRPSGASPATGESCSTRISRRPHR